VSEVASVIVEGGRNYRVEASRAFRQRLATLEALVETLSRSKENLDALMFPAGFFCTTRSSRVQEIADRVLDRLNQLNPSFPVVWGIDGWTEDAKHGVQCGPSGYPYFVFARLPGNPNYVRFQQKATSAAEGRDHQLAARWNRRSITIDETRTALLICGECWSDRLLERVRLARPILLLIPAHRNVNLSGGMSRRSWHLHLNRFNEETGIPVVLSEHSRSPWRHDYSWGGRRVRELEAPEGLQVPCTLKLTEL
jgi:hypothetical protein